VFQRTTAGDERLCPKKKEKKGALAFFARKKEPCLNGATAFLSQAKKMEDGREKRALGEERRSSLLWGEKTCS